TSSLRCKPHGHAGGDVHGSSGDGVRLQSRPADPLSMENLHCSMTLILACCFCPVCGDSLLLHGLLHDGDA
ncbi:hypothetical protein NHX12_008784, partial [Muraenolepis orangiensis]